MNQLNVVINGFLTGIGVGLAYLLWHALKLNAGVC